MKSFFYGSVTSRCAGCGRALERSTTEKPKGRNAKGKIQFDYCPEGKGCKKMGASEVTILNYEPAPPVVVVGKKEKKPT